MESKERLKELKIQLHQMETTVDRFYFMATQTGVHPFVEFAGLMREYIKICEQTLRQGNDYSLLNLWRGSHDYTINDYNILYINEKLECIFDGLFVMQQKGADHDNGQDRPPQ